MTNGFESNFKVYPVQMVTKVSALSREKGKQDKRQFNSSKNSLFDTILNQKIETGTPADCYAVTYTSDRQLKTCYYHQSREYTF